MSMRIIYTTAKNLTEAKKISKHLLQNKLIACANIFPITSMYNWKNKIKEENEFVLLLKTKTKNYKKIEEEIKKIHSYDLPAIYSWKADEVSKEYDDWVNKELK